MPTPDQPNDDDVEQDIEEEAEEELADHPTPTRSKLLSPASDGNPLQQVISH